MHDLARKRRVTSLSFEEEVAAAKIEDEDDFVFGKQKKTDLAPDQPNQDPNNPISGDPPSEPKQKQKPPAK